MAQDSNLYSLNQNQMCYHYTNPRYSLPSQVGNNKICKPMSIIKKQMNKDTLLLITSDKILKINNNLYNHIHAKLPCFGSRTRTCDLWIMRPTSYQLLHPDILYLKIPPAFTSKRYYYNSILNVINITKIQIKYYNLCFKKNKNMKDHLHRRLNKWTRMDSHHRPSD